MELRQGVSLLPYNTFGIDVQAEYFTEVTALADLQEAAALPHRMRPLGGGSNVLLTANVPGLVVRNALKGITLLREDDQYVWLQVASGEVWHELVLHAIDRGWGGIENLALIPGTVGAAPMQNIGAYGVEAREVIEDVTFLHLPDKKLVTFSNADCLFGYRESIFKHGFRDKAFITSVSFRLSKQPVFRTNYGAIEQELRTMGVQELSIKAIAQAVINIRSSKLPDPAVVGNAGSFFKNPEILRVHYEQLLGQYPGMPSYPVGSDTVKVPAAWLIEQDGWKGYRDGDIGVHDRQALVLVNYGHAHGNQIWELSGRIIASVQERFGITLEREVQVW